MGVSWYCERVHLVLMVSGLYFGHPKGGVRSAVLKMYCILMHLLMWEETLRHLLHISQPGLFRKLTIVVLNLMSSGFALSTILNSRKLTKFEKLYKRLYNSQTTEMIPYSKQQRRVALFATMGYVLFAVGGLVLFSMLTALPSIGGKSMRYSMEPLTEDSEAFLPLMYLHIPLLAFMFQIWGSCCTVFGLVSYVIVKEFNMVTKQVEDAIDENGQSRADLERMRRRHGIVCQMVSVANDTFKDFIGISLLGIVVLICLLVYNFAKGDKDLTLILTTAMKAITTIIAFFVIILCSIWINISAQGPTEYLYTLNIDLLTSKSRSTVNLFLARVSGGAIGLTASDMFIIDKSVILTIGGTILTYAVVMFSFPTSPDNCGIEPKLNSSTFINNTVA